MKYTLYKENKIQRQKRALVHSFQKLKTKQLDLFLQEQLEIAIMEKKQIFLQFTLFCLFLHVEEGDISPCSLDL